VRTPARVIDSLFSTANLADRRKRTAPSHKRVWASQTRDKDTFIADVKAEMIRRDPVHEHTWVIVTDGERALQRCVCQSFENVTLVLDLLHVLEKLWKAAHALYREGSPEAELFVRHRAERILLRHGQPGRQRTTPDRHQAPAHRRLGQGDPPGRRLPLPQPRADALRPVSRQRLADRFRHRRGRLQEPHPRPVRTLRHALDPETAEALLQLRAAHLSHDFDDYWEYHVKQDQQCLYRKDSWQVVLK